VSFSGELALGALESIMKSPLTLLLLLAIVPVSAAAEPNLPEARQRWLHGNYEEARALYEALAKEDKNAEAASIGLSLAWQSQGEYEKALAVLDKALTKLPKSCPLHALRAQLLYFRGRWEDATKAVDEALAIDKDHFLARWVQAQIYRDSGELKKADTAFRWFVRTYTARSDADRDIKDPDELLLVGLAGSENARWNNLADQFQFILTDIYGDALKADKDFWPAEYEAGVLLLEKYNRGEALAAFDKALAINPRAAEALVGKGIAALQKYEVPEAERLADRALKINPKLPDALNLRADIHLAIGHLDKAMQELERSRQVNPSNETTLARIAACLALKQDKEGLAKVVKEVEEHDAKPGMFYYILGAQLEDRRRFPEAELYFKKSADLWPMLPAPRNGLGLLYMRLGREEEARPLLEKGFNADTFNVRVSNMLKVLRHLDSYETLKTEHFRIRFDPKNDQDLVRFMAKFLETTYTDLAAKFQYTPPEPILLEIFNNHEMFSGRTTGLPDLHTIGACTGRMVALVSPRGKDLKEKGIRAPFNWARVLRHELVHIFNLEQTHFLVPHWYTEGLAVMNEGFPRPQSWNQLLLERVPAKELMNLNTIDLGFIRPRTPLDWNMAYCQSQLYVEFMKEKYGPEAVGQLLAAYASGLDTVAALDKVCKVDQETFEKGYREFLDDLLKTIRGKPPSKIRTFLQLQEAHEREPEDADITAQLAEQYLLRRRQADARKLIESVLAKKPGHPLASYVKARLLQNAGDEDQALKVLETALAGDLREPKVLQALGRLYFEAKNFAKAAEIFELGRTVEPYESKWLAELVRTYAQTGDRDKQIEMLKELILTDPDDLEQRKLLTRLLIETGRFEEAETVGRQALEIDVLDAEALRNLGDALYAEKKYAETIEFYRMFLEIESKADPTRLRLAEAYLETGDKQKADTEVTLVLARDPENDIAKKLRERLAK
jgi:tetratricopeptide (TPR) repeat protein